MKSLAKTFAYGSAVLAVVIASSLSGCSSSDSKDTGSAGSGGSGTGGTSGGSSSGGTSSAGHAGTSSGTGGTGGSAIGAAGADTMGGSGGSDTTGTAGADTMGSAGADTMGAAGATATGTAVGKFCNTVQFGTEADPMDITLRLEIGTAPDLVTIEALSGTCVPTSGACKSLPLGTDLPVKLIDPTAGDAVLDSAIATISDGDEFVFYTKLGTDGPLIEGGTLDTTQGTCSDFQYSQVPTN